MLNCLIVSSIVGGLGNQLYILSLSVIRAIQFDTALVWPTDMATSPGFANSPTYWDTFFRHAVSLHTVNITMCTPVVREIIAPDLSQWPTHESLTFDHSGSIRMSGISATLPDLLPYKSHLRAIFHHEHHEQHFHHLYPGRNLVISFRSYAEEKHPEWATPFGYYKRALARVLSPNHTVHIFGESGGIEEFAAKIKLLLSPAQGERLVVWPGVRDKPTTSLHMAYMIAADDFILCHSSFHVWGAFLTGCNNSVVVHDGTYDYGAVRAWIQLNPRD